MNSRINEGGDSLAAYGLDTKHLDIKIGEEIIIKKFDGFNTETTAAVPCLRGKYLVAEEYPRGYLLRKISSGGYNIFVLKIDLVRPNYIDWTYAH